MIGLVFVAIWVDTRPEGASFHGARRGRCRCYEAHWVAQFFIVGSIFSSHVLIR